VASITSWTRLEPRTQRDDLQDSLAARLHDPLWQLARQWQIGEFTAEDTGSPVSVRVRVEHAPLTRYRAGGASAPVEPYDVVAGGPLEARVEGERAAATARLATVAGLHFLRLLAARGMSRYAAAYTTRYALAWPTDDPRLDPAAARFLTVVGGRVPDGVRLEADLRPALAGPAGSLPAEPAIASGDRVVVTDAARAFLAWYAAEAGGATATGGDAWQRERLEYEFAVAAPAPTGQHVLVAPEYPGGRLDWADLEHDAGASLGGPDAGALRVETRTVIPTPVTYRGMPATRWWEFEDADVDFGRVEAGPTDLLRLLLVSFALDFGNDWFVVPVELDVGAVCRVRSLVVTDSFGQRTLVRPAAQVDGARRDWRMFTPTPVTPPAANAADLSAELLLLAPATAPGLHGEPVEEVLLLRDEMANLGWAVERVVESAVGGRLDRVEAYRATGREGSGSTTGSGALHYRLATTVPNYWLPLVPVRIAPDRPDVRLRRGRVLLDRGGEPTTPPALGRVLDPGQPLEVYEEEVPRAGARVTRAYQYARWSDGTSHVWVGRRKQPGRGEGWSGLRFDVVEPA
jgi:hypothetical protein